MTMAADPISLPPPQAPDFIPHAQADAAPAAPAMIPHDAAAAAPALIAHAQAAPPQAATFNFMRSHSVYDPRQNAKVRPSVEMLWRSVEADPQSNSADVAQFASVLKDRMDQARSQTPKGPQTLQHIQMDPSHDQFDNPIMPQTTMAEKIVRQYGGWDTMPDAAKSRFTQLMSASAKAAKGLATPYTDVVNGYSAGMEPIQRLGFGFQKSVLSPQEKSQLTAAMPAAAALFAQGGLFTLNTLGIGPEAEQSPEEQRAFQEIQDAQQQAHPVLGTAATLAGNLIDPVGRYAAHGVGRALEPVLGETPSLVRSIAAKSPAAVAQAILKPAVSGGVTNAAFAAGNTLAQGRAPSVEELAQANEQGMIMQPLIHHAVGAVGDLITGSPEQHALAGRLAADFPDMKGGDAHALAQRLLAAGITPEKYDSLNSAGAPANPQTATAAPPQVSQIAQPAAGPGRPGPNVGASEALRPAEQAQGTPGGGEKSTGAALTPPAFIPHTQESSNAATELEQPRGIRTEPENGNGRGQAAEAGPGNRLQPAAAEQGGGQAEAQEQPGAAGGREVAQLSGVSVKGSVAPGDSATPTGGGSKYGRSAPEQPLQSNPARDEGKIKQEFSQRAISDKLIGWLNARDEARGAGDNGEPIVLHPDALDGIGGKGKGIEAAQSRALRMRLSKFVDEDKWSEMTQDMNAQQISRLERSMLSRAMQTTETKSDKVARAITEAKASDDPRAQFLAHYMENKPTMGQQVPKEWLDVGKLTEDDAGKTFEIHREKFRVDVDDAGKVILRDHVTYEHPEELGKIPIDKGTWPGEEPELPEGEFAPEEKKTTGQQLGLLGERSAGGITGSKTASMFGDVRRGAASKLEEQPEPTALERKFSGTKSGELPGMGELPAADKAKGELDVGDKFPFPGAKANDKYPAVADVRMTLDGQRQYKVKFSEKTEPQWMPSPRPFNPGEDIGQRGLSEGPPGAMQVKPIAKASAEPEQGTLANMRDRFLGALAVRGRYLPLARRMGADIAQAFTRRANEPTSLTDDAHLAFTREAFGGKDDAAAQETKARWWQLGQAIRGINAQEKAQARNPDLTPEELDSLWTGPKMTREEINTAMADPAMKKAADIWNEKYSPTLSAIRQKHGLLMDPLAANRERFPFFINMPTEFEGPAGTDTSAQAGKAFNRKFGGTGNYENDPDEGIRAIFRGHFTTDATQDLANLIRTRYSSRMPDDVLQANGYTDTIAGKKTNLQQIDLGEKPEAMARARFATKAMLDSQAATARWGELNAGNPKEAAIKQSAKVAMEKAKDQAEMARRMAEAAKSDKVWVPEDVASEWDRLKRPQENRDTLYDKINGAWQRVATTFTFLPHIARVASLAASRLARTGQISTPSDVLRFLPSWLGSNELAMAQAHGMNGTPWGSAMQYLTDSWGANRAIGHGAEGETRGGILNFGHRVLFDPESGADILARRVVGETYLRQVLGNATVDNLQRAVSSGKISALEAFRHFRNRLSPDQAIDAGQYVNGTLGFSNYRTRSGLLNALQRGGVPFIGSESGMIPADMARIGSMGLNPRMLGHMVKDGRIKQAAVGASAVLGSGALGLYAAMNGLNYMNTLAQTGSGRFMWQNDPGHRNDLWLGPGVHLGNIDASVSRGERLMGLQDQLEKKGTLNAKQTVQDAALANVNESAATLAPHLKVAFELLTRIAGHPSTLYFGREAHGGGISLRKAKWGDSVPAIPNIVDALTDKHVNAQSVPAAAAQDLAKDTLGAKLSFGH